MRRPRFALLILGTLLAVLTGCLLDSDEETYGIDGHVRDEAGKPVADVLIRKTGGESGSTYTRSSGYYWIPVSKHSDEIALIALKGGWAFCPGRREFADLSVRHHDQDFTGFYSGEIVIDGFVLNVAGEPVEGVKVINREPGILNGLTSVTNYMGYYRFNSVIAGFKYRLVPSKPGCAFSPPERVYAFPARDYLYQDFIMSCVESFGIDGHVRDCDGDPIAGVTLIAMPDDIAAVTGEDGFYSMEGLSASGAIGVTPSKPGCAFSPHSKTVYPAPGGVSGVDFGAYCGAVYSISGNVFVDGDTPLPDMGVTIVGGCSQHSHVRYTDEAGRYEFAGLHGGFDYIIRPEPMAYAVEPESIVIEGLDRDHADQDFAFTSEMVSFRVSGYVRDREGNPLEGREVDFGYLKPRTGDAHGVAGGRPGAPLLPAITDEEGHFSFPLPRSFTAAFHLAEPGCYFIPYARWCRGDRDHDSQDFVAHCGGGTAISGYVRDVFGQPAPYVRVNLIGEGYYPPPFARTDSTGYYEFLNLPNGLELTVRPTSAYSIPYEGCIFCPAERAYHNVEEDYRDQDFTMSCPHH